MATQGWIAEKLADWVKKNPGQGAKAARTKLEGEFNFQLKYSKAWAGMKLALEQMHGKYEESFQLLFNWKAEIEKRCPGSIVEIDLVKEKDKYYFNRVFVAFKPCIDGFLAGCRPYIGVDATALNGKYVGQLASATAVDGHNWLYYVAYAIFDSETKDNWVWFMQQLRRAVGCPHGLVISSDACKGLEIAVGDVFPECEYRECMRHLYQNFMKKIHGKVYTDHLYPAARGFTEHKFRWHMQKIFEADPKAIEYLETHHNKICYRCGFGVDSKVDYLTNNISESFNKQIKDLKGLNLCELLDRIRELIMVKFNVRRHVGRHLAGLVLPQVLKMLNALSKTIGPHKVAWNTEHEAEITLYDVKPYDQRHTVNLQQGTCSCRKFQISGKPCIHALTFICSMRGAKIESFVDDYYSVAKFRAAYAGALPTMTDKTQWEQVNLGFLVNPPIQEKRPAGRPRVQRIRGFLEDPGRKVVKCKKCGRKGHFQKTCNLPP
jgi:hypothetical protein